MILKAFDSKLSELGYRIEPPGLRFPKRCAWTRKLSKNIGGYIIFNDRRPKGGNLIIDLWIAPIAMPDDTMTQLEIGTKIMLLDFHECNSLIIDEVAKKLGYYEMALPILRDCAEREFLDPARKTRILPFFHWSKNALLLAGERMNLSEWNEFREVSRRVAARKISDKELLAYFEKALGPVLRDYVESDHPSKRVVAGCYGVLNAQIAEMLFDGEL